MTDTQHIDMNNAIDLVMHAERNNFVRGSAVWGPIYRGMVSFFVPSPRGNEVLIDRIDLHWDFFSGIIRTASGRSFDARRWEW